MITCQFLRIDTVEIRFGSRQGRRLLTAPAQIPACGLPAASHAFKRP